MPLVDAPDGAASPRIGDGVRGGGVPGVKTAHLHHLCRAQTGAACRAGPAGRTDIPEAARNRAAAGVPHQAAQVPAAGNTPGGVAGGDGTVVVVADQAADLAGAAHGSGSVTVDDDSVIGPGESPDAELPAHPSRRVAASDGTAAPTHQTAGIVVGAAAHGAGGVAVGERPGGSEGPDQSPDGVTGAAHVGRFVAVADRAVGRADQGADAGCPAHAPAA